jgi:hypothetical protein
MSVFFNICPLADIGPWFCTEIYKMYSWINFLRFMIFISSCGFTLRTDYCVVSCVVEGWVPCWTEVGCSLSLVPFLMVRLPWVGRSLVLIFYHLATELLHMCPGSRPRFPRHTQYSSSVRCYIFSKKILCCLLLLTALLFIVLRDFYIIVREDDLCVCVS